MGIEYSSLNHFLGNPFAAYASVTEQFFVQTGRARGEKKTADEHR
jgi:hypothetical protein